MERFWSKVDKGAACWIWSACQDKDGYGHFKISGKVRKAHRVAYELIVGPIPEEKVLDHLCRNKSCVNPAHLEPVTQGENVMRGDTLAADQVRRTHCPAGHAYDEANTYRLGNARFCRACHRARNRKYYANLRKD